jgi:hypothetical protein
MSDLAAQVREALSAFAREGVQPFLDEVREYFRLFQQEALLDELLG